MSGRKETHKIISAIYINESYLITRTPVLYMELLNNNIPQRYSWFCFSTCHIYALVATLYFSCKQPLLKIVGGFMVGLFVTSFMYWKKPVDYSFAHRVDKVMVYASIIYNSYATYYTSKLVFTIWIVVICVCGIVYSTNEVLYYYQVCRPNNLLKSNPKFKIQKYKNFKHKCVFQKYFSIEPTWYGTKEREFAYYRYIITHGLGVHLFTGGIAGITIAVICLLTEI